MTAYRLQALLFALMGTLLSSSGTAELIAGEPAPVRALTFNIRYDNPADGENGWKHRRDGVAKADRGTKG